MGNPLWVNDICGLEKSAIKEPNECNQSIPRTTSAPSIGRR